MKWKSSEDKNIFSLDTKKLIQVSKLKTIIKSHSDYSKLYFLYCYHTDQIALHTNNCLQIFKIFVFHVHLTKFI